MDWTSDVAFCMALNWNDYEGYFWMTLAVVVVATLKSVVLFIWRMNQTLSEHYISYWEKHMPGGFIVLPVLFLLSGFSPLYWDLLLTSHIDFPLHPKNRHNIPREKLVHLIVENMCSIAITLAFTTREIVTDIAYVSICFSILTTFVLITAGVFEQSHDTISQKRETLELEFTVKNPNKMHSKWQVQEHLQSVLETHFDIRCWWMLRLENKVMLYMMISSIGTIHVSPDMLLEKISKEIIIFLEAEEGTSNVDGELHKTRRSTITMMPSFIGSTLRLGNAGDIEMAEIGTKDPEIHAGTTAGDYGGVAFPADYPDFKKGDFVQVRHPYGLLNAIIWEYENNCEDSSATCIILESESAKDLVGQSIAVFKRDLSFARRIPGRKNSHAGELITED